MAQEFHVSEQRDHKALAPIGTGRPSLAADPGSSSAAPWPSSSAHGYPGHLHFSGEREGQFQETQVPRLAPLADHRQNHRHTRSEPLDRNGYSLVSQVSAAPTIDTSRPIQMPRALLSTMTGVPYPVGYQDDSGSGLMAAMDDGNREIAAVWARYMEETAALGADVAIPDGTEQPNTIYKDIISFFVKRPQAVLTASARANMRFRLRDTCRYQITQQDRVDFAPLVDARPRNYELIRRAAILRRFLGEKQAARLPIRYDIPGISFGEYGGNIRLDMVLAEKGMLTGEGLESLYGVGYAAIKSLRNASLKFSEVLEEYCMVQMICQCSEYKVILDPLLRSLRKATKEFADSRGHSSNAANKRKKAIGNLKEGLAAVW